jgi:16S rRNA processing protein RimM
VKEGLLQFGYVSRAHALTGEVVVRTFDPASEVLAEVDRVVAKLRSGEERELTLEAVAEAPKSDLLVTFAEIQKRPDAEALVGAVLFVYRDDLDAPEAGEFFQGDLLGLTAVDESGKTLGIVEEVMNSGPVPNLVIRGEGLPEVMVPFIEEFVPTVDLEQRRVVVRPLNLD